MARSAMKKWLACLLALCMLLALCACGGKAPAPVPEDPKSVMRAATEKLNEAKSISFDMVMEMTMGSQGQSMDLGMTMTADTIKEPLQLHGNIKMEMLGLDTEFYMVQKDGALTTYTGIKENGAVSEWYKSSVSDDDLEAIQQQTASFDADSSFSTQLEIADNLMAVGTETVNGKQATRYDGVIHGSDLSKSLGQTDAASTLDLLGIDPSQLEGDAPISIWIYEDGLPARYDIDMTELIGQLMAQNEDTADLELSAMRISMTITGVDTVSEIVIPEEALQAQEIPAEDDFEDDTPEEVVQNGDTFTAGGMSITLTEDFEASSMPGFTSCFMTEDVINLNLREPFSLMDGAGDLTVEEYSQLVLENNGMSVADLKDFDGIPGFEYDYTDEESGDVYHYRVFLYKSGDAFWLVQFATRQDSFAAYDAQINQWAQSVTFAG